MQSIHASFFSIQPLHDGLFAMNKRWDVIFGSTVFNGTEWGEEQDKSVSEDDLF